MLADLDPYNAEHVLGVVRRFGGLTESAQHPAGESLTFWQRLIGELLPIASAWDVDGALRDKAVVRQAELAGLELWRKLVADHDGRNRYEPDGFTVALRCPDMRAFWRAQAVYSIAVQNCFRRCSFCGWWFSLSNGRSDRRYCSNYHRIASAAGRRAPQRFWAEAG